MIGVKSKCESTRIQSPASETGNQKHEVSMTPFI
uniref:Uncharacterized protein n=1 Tax=Picea glauca TaxID=3330 RepID=A0A101LZS5_PICGL|nr:hypothetical protein ABT39_MTgene5371 [Picea glauca]